MKKQGNVEQAILEANRELRVENAELTMKLCARENREPVTVEWLRGLTRKGGTGRFAGRFGVPENAACRIEGEEQPMREGWEGTFKLCVTFALPFLKGGALEHKNKEEGRTHGQPVLHGNNAALVKARRLLGLSQADFSRCLGMTYSDVLKAEAGLCTVDLNWVERAERMVRERQAKVKAAEDGLAPVLLVQDVRATEGTGQDGMDAVVAMLNKVQKDSVRARIALVETVKQMDASANALHMVSETLKRLGETR